MSGFIEWMTEDHHQMPPPRHMPPPRSQMQPATMFMPPTPPPVPMAPIPWKEPEAKAEKSHVGFDNLSLEQLEMMAKMRNQTIENLRQEVQDFANFDDIHEKRLMALEEQFNHLTVGQELRLKAPMLHKIRKVVRESHLLDHDMEMERLKEAYMAEDACDQWADLDPWTYIHSQNLVLGRGYVGLDQHFIERQKMKEQIEADMHPVVHRTHYAGHVSKPAEDVDGIFVKEAGIYKRHLLHPAPYRNQFWLSLDGPTRNDEEAARQMHKEVMEDPVAQRIMRQNAAGSGEDAAATDWLGKLKRGEIVDLDQNKPTVSGFRMPPWMY